MRKLRLFLQFVLTLVTLVVVAVAIVTVNAYRALPSADSVAVFDTNLGLTAPVTVVRDARGVPTITAGDENDAAFALGYVHAQDRLFEMELTRRTGQGRLSEVIGKMGLSTDRFIRTLGLYRRTEADFATLDPAVQRLSQSYAAGVNAWLTTRDRPLPLEFYLLWLTPEPWKPADSLVWQKLMGLQLSGNWDEELLRAAAETKLGPERARMLWADPRLDDPITVEPPTTSPVKETRNAPERDEHFADLLPDRLLKELLSALTPTLASNAWAVAGTHTATGKPLLANDPHLGFQLPSIWYLAIIKTPGLTLTGATVPGVPLHILGHNGAVAWGITTTHGDTQDLFIEHAIADGRSYETPDGPAAFVTREETIAVRFDKPVTITVRETRHGPVLSDVLSPARIPADLKGGDRVLALSSTVLQAEDHSADALYRMARATDAETFLAATAQFQSPQQNIMFADAEHIGFIAAGRLPIRKAGDGTRPVPGWTGEYDWTGWVPFESLPQSFDPPGGLLVNANNRIVAADAGPFVAAHWPEAYRARRIIEVLRGARAPLTAIEMSALQTDTVSIAAREMLPLLLPHVEARTDEERALLKSLAAWDGTMDRARPEPLIYAVWLDHVKRAILADDLGPLYESYWGPHPDVLRHILETDDAATGTKWCDDVSTPMGETCAERIQTSWIRTMTWLSNHEKKPAADWRWDDFHRAAFDHIALKSVWGLNQLASRSVPSSGGDFTINRGSFRDSGDQQPLSHIHGAGLRAVYDLADLAQSRFALAGGQSGQITSAHYDDLLLAWRDGSTFALTPTAAETPDSHRLILSPSP